MQNLLDGLSEADQRHTPYDCAASRVKYTQVAPSLDVRERFVT